MADARSVDEGSPKRRFGCLQIVGFGIAIIFALAIIGALVPNPEKTGSTGKSANATATSVSDALQPETPVETVLDVSPEELRSAFERNEVAAQRQYGDQKLRVAGTVEAIELDITNDPVVKFETSQPYSHVSAYMADDQADAAVTLSKGKKATVICNKVGEVVGTPVLSDCIIQ